MVGEGQEVSRRDMAPAAGGLGVPHQLEATELVVVEQPDRVADALVPTGREHPRRRRHVQQRPRGIGAGRGAVLHRCRCGGRGEQQQQRQQPWPIEVACRRPLAGSGALQRHLEQRRRPQLSGGGRPADSRVDRRQFDAAEAP